MLRRTALAGLVFAALSPYAAADADTPRYDEAFKDAVATWRMRDLTDDAGGSELRAFGAVTVGTPLTGAERLASLAAGGDGHVAEFEGGYLDAGQGAGGRLNLTGSALTVAVRLRSPSGVWGMPLFNKYGGHDRLVYNLYSSPSAIGVELGTRDTAGMGAFTPHWRRSARRRGTL